jgi:hypothetical protein
MKNYKNVFIRLTAFCLVSLVPFSATWSADEDMISQVYLEFDPETGTFVTTQDPTLMNNKSQHAAGQSKQIEQIQQNQDMLASGQDSMDAQSPVAAAPMSQQSPMTSNDGSGASSTTMIAVGVGLLLLVGIIAWVRKSQQSA